MKHYWSGLVAAGAMAATVTLAGQSQSPANTPPPDAASPAGVQRTPTAPSAQTRTGNTVTIAGCIQNAPATAMAGNTGAGAGAPGAGAAGADRGGNTGNTGNAGGATTGNNRGGNTAGNTSGTTAGNAPGNARDAGAAGNRGTTGSSFILANASMGTASPGATRGAVGTSGSATSYRLEGETAMLSAHVNHQVRITGTVQESAASSTGSANAAPGSTAAGPTLRVESVTMVADTCAAAGAQGSGNQGAQPQGNRPQGGAGGATGSGNQGNTTRPQP